MTEPTLKRLCGALALALAALPVWSQTTAQAAAPSASAKPRIEKAADMPRFSYPLAGSLEAIVRSPEAFAPLSAALRRDAEAVLAGYDIADKGTRRDLITQLALLDFLDGQYARSLARADEVRALQDKPADRLLSGLRLRAMATVAQRHAPGSAAYLAAVGEFIGQQLAAMPYPLIANDIKQAKAGAEYLGEALVLGRLREVLQPMAAATGSLSSDFASGLLYARFGLVGTLPLKATLVDAYSAYLARHQVQKADIWAARNVVLPAGGPHTAVPLAVWDSGVDLSLFASQLRRGADGQPAVIAFDKQARPAPGSLMPIPPGLVGRLPALAAQTKGLSDLQSNIDSPEAQAVKALLSGLSPERYKPVIEELTLASHYAHGTHVAGIAMAGNPHAQLVVARIEFSHTLRPDPCPSRELALRDAANYPQVIAFFQRQGVRVVNMSWGGSVGAVERELEQCGLGGSADARKALARELFDTLKGALTRAFASAPEILFVTAAGNSNNDASFVEDTPADIVLPNLVTVGAVDLAGDEAGFTSYGPTVKVHANGHQVESYLPGGLRVALSGTSMAAPQVANLAAKLLAIKPTLTPAALIEVITRTAERSADGRRILMHPQKALAAVQAMP